MSDWRFHHPVVFNFICRVSRLDVIYVGASPGQDNTAEFSGQVAQHNAGNPRRIRTEVVVNFLKQRQEWARFTSACGRGWNLTKIILWELTVVFFFQKKNIGRDEIANIRLGS